MPRIWPWHLLRMCLFCFLCLFLRFFISPLVAGPLFWTVSWYQIFLLCMKYIYIHPSVGFYCWFFVLDCQSRMFCVGKMSIFMIRHVYRSLRCDLHVSWQKLSIVVSLPQYYIRRVATHRNTQHTQYKSWVTKSRNSLHHSTTSISDLTSPHLRKRTGWLSGKTKYSNSLV